MIVISPTDRLRRAGRACRRQAAGFTLVELMVTISIIALLSSMVLVGLSGVQSSSREHRTRAMILRIQTLLNDHLATYDTRRLPIPNAMFQLVAEDRFGTNYTKQEFEFLKLEAKRELMRLEMPTRIADVTGEPLWFRNPGDTESINPNLALLWSYRARASRSTWEDSPGYQEAECLYLILSRMYIDDTNGLDFFNDNEIGDIDEDGMPEIWDAWGNPIAFVLWAPGFGTIPVEGGLPEVSLMHNDGRKIEGGSVVFDAANLKKDRFDIMEVDVIPRGPDGDLPTFDLTPLVFSAGVDGEFNIAVFRPGKNRGFTVDELIEINDPFHVQAGNGAVTRVFRSGEVLNPDSRDHEDNIHNHYIEAR